MSGARFRNTRSADRNLGDERNVCGLPSIATVLRSTPSTVRRWARSGGVDTKRQFDPLRLLRHPSYSNGVPIQRRERLEAWRVRTWGSEEERAALRVLMGWREIAEMAEVDIDTAQALAARACDPLPVQPKRRFNQATGQYEVWAYADAIRDWLMAHMLPWVLTGPPTRRADVCPPKPKKPVRAT